MSRVTTLAIYWGSKKETSESCASNILKTYSVLGSASPILSAWYEKAHSKRSAMGADCISSLQIEQLVMLLEKNINRGEIYGNPINELGFTLSQWNKILGDDSSALRITCGSYSTNPNLINAVVLNLPKSMTELNSESFVIFHQLLGGLIKVWKPEWGAVFNVNSPNLETQNVGKPFFDQMLWTNGKMQLPFDVAALDDIGKVEMAGSKLYVKDPLLYRAR